MSFLISLVMGWTGAGPAASRLLIYAIGALAIVTSIWLYGNSRYDAGVAWMKEQNRIADQEQTEEREQINEDVEGLTDIELCRELGGLQCDGPDE